MIRPMKVADAEWAAGQHAALMQHSVFARFGTGFLACFYRCFARSPHAIAFVHEEQGRPGAVITATIDRPAFLRELLRRHGLSLAAGALSGILRQPGLLAAVQPLRYLREIPADDTSAELIYITVAEQSRARGIARALIAATLDECARRNVLKVKVTIESENAPIKRILQSAGFAVTKTFFFAGKQNDLLENTLPRQANKVFTA